MEAHKHPWMARFSVSLIMLILGFIGMIVADVHRDGSWLYWKWIIPVYAILALWLSWYVRQRSDTLRIVTLWHELLHWLGLIASVFLVSFFVHQGIMSRFVAGLFDLTLLALALFIAGIYIETTFLFVGIALGLFALLASYVVEYFYAISLPIALGGIAFLIIYFWITHRKIKKE